MKPVNVVIGVVVLTSLIFSYFFIHENNPEKKVVKVFHAGSLSVPFEEVEKEFEEKHNSIDVQRFSMGSAKAIRQITDVGRKADVLAVADYSLIPNMMYPKYADWYIMFARNKMVLVYSKKSKYANLINSSNWYEILQKKDVSLGFSNPNLDPCGYRALMVLKLADIYYNTSLFDIVVKNTAITASYKNGTYIINVPENLNPNAKKIVIREKSVNLIAMVEEGGVDYAFEYLSVAVQHGLRYIQLPEQLELSDLSCSDYYKKVEVITSDGKTKKGKAIIYGITVPKNSDSKENGIKFVKFLVSKDGSKILKKYGQEPLKPAIGYGNIPKELRRMVKVNED